MNFKKLDKETLNKIKIKAESILSRNGNKITFKNFILSDDGYIQGSIIIKNVGSVFTEELNKLHVQYVSPIDLFTIELRVVYNSKEL